MVTLSGGGETFQTIVSRVAGDFKSRESRKKKFRTCASRVFGFWISAKPLTIKHNSFYFKRIATFYAGFRKATPQENSSNREAGVIRS